MKNRDKLRDDRGNPIAHYKGNNLYQDIKFHFETREMCDEAEKNCKEYFDWLESFCDSYHEKKLKKDSFQEAVKKCEREVSKWPKWKQKIVITAKAFKTGKFFKDEK